MKPAGKSVTPYPDDPLEQQLWKKLRRQQLEYAAGLRLFMAEAARRADEAKLPPSRYAMKLKGIKRCRR